METITDILGIEVEESVALSDDVDARAMRQAIDLAWQGLGRTDPNPMVGAVVVADGRVVGTGFHSHCGASHAETRALVEAGNAARGATLYVSLEPCAHHGQTPPCVDAVIASGIARVVIPNLDPDPRVSGRGVAALRSAGVEVVSGCLSAAAIMQNLKYYRDRLGLGPVVTLKLAVSADGMISGARGRRDQITGESSLRFGHGLRACHESVLVGVETAIVDRPALDCRGVDSGAAPMPIVLDTGLRLGPDNRWAQEKRPYTIVCGDSADKKRKQALEQTGARVISVPVRDGRVDIAEALAALREQGTGSVLVEGGAEVFSSFVRCGHWHGFYLLQAEHSLGPGGVPMATGGTDVAGSMKLVEKCQLDQDTLYWFMNDRALDEILNAMETARSC